MIMIKMTITTVIKFKNSDKINRTFEKLVNIFLVQVTHVTKYLTIWEKKKKGDLGRINEKMV